MYFNFAMLKFFLPNQISVSGVVFIFLISFGIDWENRCGNSDHITSVCDVYPVIHRDRINGIIVDEDFMRNWAKDAGTQRREGKCPLPLQMPFVKLHTNPHKHCCFIFVCDASHVNKPALFIPLPPATSCQTLLLSFFSCCILFCPGFPLCPVIHLPLFPLCLSLAQCPARSLESNSKTKRL